MSFGASRLASFHYRACENSVELSTFSDGILTVNFPHFPLWEGCGRKGGDRRGRSGTTRALNFYTLLGAAAVKSTTSSASKTASARLPRPPVVALINRPASIVRFNKVQQSGTQHGISPCRVKRLSYPLAIHCRFEIHFSPPSPPRIIFFFRNHTPRVVRSGWH